MSAISNYLENKILDFVLRDQAFAQPTPYLALFTSAPNDDGSGAEVSGGSYARKPVTFSAAANRQISNSAQVVFNQATADWGNITHVAIFDAVTAGNMLWWGALASPVTVLNGYTFKVQAGQLTPSFQAGAVTTFLANKLLDHIFNVAAYTPPTTVYAALFTTATSDGGGGTEVSGTGYARKSVTFSAASGGATSNSNQLDYGVAGSNWGTISHGAIMDALTAGNMLWHGALQVAITINQNDQLIFQVGDFDVSVD